MLPSPFARTVRTAAVAWSHRGSLLPSSNRNDSLRLSYYWTTSKSCWFSSSTSSNSTVTTSRPFRILGLQQVAIGSTDRPALHQLWVDVLGIAPTRRNITIQSENLVEDILSIGGGLDAPYCAVEIDLMTPIDVNKSPKVHIPPLNHIGLWVDDLAAAVVWMTNFGVRFTPGGIRTGAAGYDVAFIHPKPSEEYPIAGNGVLIELVQAPPPIVAALATTTTTTTTTTPRTSGVGAA